MKSKFEKRTSTKEGPTMSQVYAGATVKGGPKRKVVKITKANLNTNYDAQETSGGGETVKSVYKKGLLVRQKRTPLSANKIIRRGIL